MPTILAVELHPTPTRRSGLRYQFTPKHHGVDPGAARWSEGLTRDEEFSVFDVADEHAIADSSGNLYGLLRGDDGTLRGLGTWGQQLAEFPFTRPGEPWHGYPIYPLNELAPENRSGDSCKPEKQVFSRMFEVGLIDKRARKRLAKGDFA